MYTDRYSFIWLFSVFARRALLRLSFAFNSARLFRPRQQQHHRSKPQRSVPSTTETTIQPMVAAGRPPPLEGLSTLAVGLAVGTTVCEVGCAVALVDDGDGVIGWRMSAPSLMMADRGLMYAMRASISAGSLERTVVVVMDGCGASVMAVDGGVVYDATVCVHSVVASTGAIFNSIEDVCQSASLSD